MPEALLVGQKEALRNCMLLLNHPLLMFGFGWPKT